MEVNVKILLNRVEKNLGYFKFKREREKENTNFGITIAWIDELKNMIFYLK